MAAVQRLIHKVRQGKWEEAIALEKRYREVESRLGFPPSKSYRSLVPTGNFIAVEREWESVAAWEATSSRTAEDPEWQALSEEFHSYEKSRYENESRGEAYMPLPQASS